MADPEVTMYADKIFEQVDRIVACTQGMSTEEINQAPPVPEANTIHVLAIHTMANVEENVLEIIGGQDVGRDRDSEFKVSGSTADEIQQRWSGLKGQVQTFLNDASPDILSTEYEHNRRGRMTGRAVLLLAATHAAEHAGQAELTRDWLIAQR